MKHTAAVSLESDEDKKVADEVKWALLGVAPAVHSGFCDSFHPYRNKTNKLDNKCNCDYSIRFLSVH